MHLSPIFFPVQSVPLALGMHNKGPIYTEKDAELISKSPYTMVVMRGFCLPMPFGIFRAGRR
jgi:hypothetical protein